MRAWHYFLVLLIGTASFATELGVSGTRFTIDGKPAFLLGCSYYAGLGASEAFAARDLDDMKALGFNWIRVWVTWAAFDNDISAVDLVTGEAREPYMAKLKWLLAECDKRGMIVNVTLSRGNGATGPVKLQTHEAHAKAVQTLVTALKPWRNWYIDLSNERNIQDKRHTSIDELAKLLQLVKQIDATRLVTASDASDPKQPEIEAYLKTVKVDFVSIHRPRFAASAKQTKEKCEQVLAWMKQAGREVPLHYDEPFRRGFGKYDPVAEDFITDLQNARAGGAAGWCFHNGHDKDTPDNQPRRSFDLRQRRLFEQLDAEETKFMEWLRKQRPGVGG